MIVIGFYRQYATPVQKRRYAKKHRDTLRNAERCINGPKSGSIGRRKRIEHGPVVRGGKCQRCIDIHSRSC